MSLLKKLFSKKEIEPRLIGEWFSDLKDEKTVRYTGDVKLSLEKNGKLTYEIGEGDKKQYFFLTFFTKNNVIITNQPSSPSEEQTEFRFDEDNGLILKFDGAETRYIKKR